MSAKAPGNRRVARSVIEAPADPEPSEISPPPGPVASTVRPPAPKRAASAKKSSFGSMLRMTAGALVVIACSVAVAWGARHYVLSSPRFAVRTVLVDGVSRRSAQDVAERGGVAVGANVFALDLDLAKQQIEADPWVEGATIVRKLPSTIQIQVVEREARAVVAIDSELFLTTADGVLFKKLEPDDPIDLPVLTGIAPEMVVSDRPGLELTVRRSLDIITELERAGVAKRFPVQEVHIERDGAIVVTLGKDAVAVHLGQPPYRGKIEQGARVLAEMAARKAQASVVFLDNDAHPERVVVRMR